MHHSSGFNVGKFKWVFTACALTFFVVAPRTAFSLDLKLSNQLSHVPDQSTSNDGQSIWGGLSRVISAGKRVIEGDSRPGDVVSSAAVAAESGIVAPGLYAPGSGSLALQPTRFSNESLGIVFPLSSKSQLVVGNLENHGAGHEREEAGMHLVNRINEHTRVFVGVQKNSGDAKETTSGFGFIYDFD